MKKCSKCCELKMYSEFHKHCKTKDGYYSSCKSCRKEDYVNNRNNLIIKQRVYDRNNKQRAADYKRNRRKNDELFRLRDNMSSLIRRSLKGYKNRSTCEEYLGCSIRELKEHLSSLFTDGMSWGNYGEWEIDHIQPISSASTIDELKELNNYKNLQPLWKKDNRKKSNKWGGETFKGMINLLITGPNYFNDYNAVVSKLSEIGVDKQECVIVTSLSTGVDTIAFDYGVVNNKEVIVYNIQDEDTKMNRTVSTATHAIVIWDGLDEKTHKMLQLVNAYGLKLIEIRV